MPTARQVLRTLHVAGASLDDQAGSGRTALHHAVASPAARPAIISYLLVHEADDTILDKQSMMPLHVACDAGAGLEVVRLLLKQGTAGIARLVDDQCQLGRTPLHYAAQKGDMSVVQVGRLLFRAALLWVPSR